MTTNQWPLCIMKKLERLLLCIQRPQREHVQYSLKVLYQEGIGMVVVLYMPHQIHSHLD